MSPLSRTTFDGFAQFAERDTSPPEALTLRQLAKLSDSDHQAHSVARRKFLARIPTVASPVVITVGNELDKLMFANNEREPGDKVHFGLSGTAGIGKTTAAADAGQHIHNRAIAEFGEHFEDGRNTCRHIPVVYVTAPAVSTFRQFIGSLLRFYDPAASGTTEAMTERLLVLMQAAGTQLVIVDDAHALRSKNANSYLVADSLKAFLNTAPVTVCFVGTGLMNSIFFGSTGGGVDDPAAQLRHRIIHLEHPSYQRPTQHEPGMFIQLLGAFETQLCHGLLKHKPGALTSVTTARWIFDQTEGVTARVAKWLSAAAIDAVGRDERLSKPMLSKVLVPGMNVVKAA